MRLLLLTLLAALTLLGCGKQEGAVVGKYSDFQVMPLEDSSKSVRLSDLKGKTVLLDFWATWCGPCRDAMPEIQKVYEQYRDKGFDVMSISAEQPGVVKTFHESVPYTFPVYLDTSGEANRAYVGEGIPTFVLVRDGQVLWSSEGYSPGMLQEAVAKELG